MPEEMNRGLGSIGATAEQSQVENVSAVPNSSLAMLNKKREADNVLQERSTGITLGKIKDEAKAELIQEMMANEADKQQRMAEREAAMGNGYRTGLYDASALQQAAMGGAMQSQMQSQPNASYSEPVVEQGNGLGRL